jgi:hypothetical protein
LVAALAAVVMTGCVTYNPVPLTNGAFPRGAVQVGDDVRVTTRSGESRRFAVGGVADGVLTDAAGQPIPPADLTMLEVKRFDKKATIITLSVLGGVIVTAIAVDAVDDCEDDPFCEFEY